MDKKIQSKINTTKYGQPPTWEEIESFLAELHMNMYHWERFFGVPANVLTQVKSGTKPLPRYAWHFVYERIKPTYGAGFIDDYSANANKNSKKTGLTKKLTSHSNTQPDLHDRTINLT